MREPRALGRELAARSATAAEVPSSCSEPAGRRDRLPRRRRAGRSRSWSRCGAPSSWRVRAWSCIDRLVDPRLLSLAPAGAELVDVGKRPGDEASAGQEAINAAPGRSGPAPRGRRPAEGRRPLRLRPGRRGGPRPQGAPASTSRSSPASRPRRGRPHRPVSRSPTAASPRATRSSPAMLQAASRAGGGLGGAGLALGGTLVVLMGVAHRRRDGATAHRRRPAGRHAGRRRRAGHRGRAADRCAPPSAASAPCDVESPATIVVGEVAALDLSWSAGCRSSVGGDRHACPRPVLHAGRAGWRRPGPYRSMLPVIEIADAADGGAALARALARVEDYDWVVFSSANAVERTFGHLRDARSLGRVKVAAVGDGTAAALSERGVVADLVPERFVAESLVAAFPEPAGAEDGTLRRPCGPPPCAAGARDVLADGLAAKGWRVERVEAYRTVRPAVPEAAVAAVEGADAVTFTSSSAVTGFLEASPARGTCPPSSPASARSRPAPRGRPACGSTSWQRSTRSTGSSTASSPGRSATGAGRKTGDRLRSCRFLPAASAACAGCPRCAASWPRSSPRRRRPRRAAVRAGGDRRPRCRSRRCRASSSTRVASLVLEAKRLASLGIPALVLFGVPTAKDPVGSGASDPDGIVQVALGELRTALGDELLLIADLCLDEYTDHGHCGLLDAARRGRQRPHPRPLRRGRGRPGRRPAPHLVAPSGMMDGQVGAIRAALDGAGHDEVGILAYAAKYASALYGPFRDAVDVTIAGGGDRKGYQQDPRNRREALEEVRARRRRGRRPRHGEAGARLPRRHRRRAGGRRRPGRRLPRERRVRHGRRRPPSAAGSTGRPWRSSTSGRSSGPART